jgi:tetratricopeptide (TPR) repeat protein
METIVTENFMKQKQCECITCHRSLAGAGMQFGAVTVAVKPLQEAQPLAYKVLSLVQVTCSHHSTRCCKWTGDYGDFFTHVISHSLSASEEDAEKHEIIVETACAIDPAREQGAKNSDHEGRISPENSGHLPFSRSSINDNTSIQSTNKSEKEIGKHDVGRQNSIESIEKDDESLHAKFSTGSRHSDSCSQPDPELFEKWNASINSVNFSHKEENNYDNEESNGEESIPQLEEDYNDEYGEMFERIMEKAEQLKRQANSKFNRGELELARQLYTKGINIMKKIEPQTEEEFQLLSDMLSNRAVAFYRAYDFEFCIEDCEEAIRYMPKADKAWIRKWRALMAMGKFGDALTFLLQAAKEIPDSKKIKTELKRCKVEMETFNKANDLLVQAKIQQAKDILDRHIEQCDNIALLILSAKVDCALGETKSALEKVNKALQLNSEHIDAIELQGMTHFFAGDTQRSVDLLLEASSRLFDSQQIKSALQRVQATHVAFDKAQSLASQGQHLEAIEFFSTAIRSSNPIPPKTALFAMLRTGRAGSYFKEEQYQAAQTDCQEILNLSPENAKALLLHAGVLIAMDKAEDARKELMKARQTWGTVDPKIDEKCRNIAWQICAEKVHEDLLHFATELEEGTSDRLPEPLQKQSRTCPDRRADSLRSSSLHVSLHNQSIKKISKRRGISNIDTKGTLCERDFEERRDERSPEPLEKHAHTSTDRHVASRNASFQTETRQLHVHGMKRLPKRRSVSHIDAKEMDVEFNMSSDHRSNSAPSRASNRRNSMKKCQTLNVVTDASCARTEECGNSGTQRRPQLRRFSSQYGDERGRQQARPRRRIPVA